MKNYSDGFLAAIVTILNARVRRGFLLAAFDLHFAIGLLFVRSFWGIIDVNFTV